MITCIWKREVTLLNVDRISFGYQPVYVYPSTGKQELFNRSSTCSGWEIKQNNRFCTFHDQSILCFIRISTGRTLIQPAEHMVLDERECKMTPSSGDRPVDQIRPTGSWRIRHATGWERVNFSFTLVLWPVDYIRSTGSTILLRRILILKSLKTFHFLFFIKITSNSLFLLILIYIIIFYFIKNKLSFIVM